MSSDVATEADQETRRLQHLGSMFDVRGLGVVVTGGGSGLGLTMGAALARAGASVTLLDREEDRLATAQEDLAADGYAVGTATADITDADALDEQFARLAASATGLHVAFANAGISAGIGPRLRSGRLTEIDRDRWRSVLDVNLTGAMNTVASAARHMTTGYGRIIVTSSVGGIRADPMVGYAYAASKAGVVGLVRNAALELAHRGILVNAIAPGLFETNIRRANPTAQAMTADFARISALKRAGRLAELEGLAVYLASPASSYVTGAVLSIDGGAALTGPNDVEV
ncbi:SDR family NAD(P)-dependent oxidoreductase [Georgenia sp. SYP-B2076]|uniref:SDR family NAD(P)-dependent oxidoreductase n=1 Tax=Georgenia sp. SYP-B2076 TaxID=2495881 RepID=UPI000F8DB277|nr:SDR family NAD(P)-dependent oxidoreductase [Georgenia sp. SYP-B2076]